MAISNGYATLADVKAAARVTDTFDDGLFEVAIESASRDIDAYCERVFYNAGSLTRVYIPADIYRLETDDLVSVTTVKSDTNGDGGFNQTWAATDYQLEPLNGIAGGIVTPYTRIRAVGDFLWPVYEPRDINAGQASVEITGVFGFASIPMAIKQATILASLRAYKRYESPTGVLGFSDVGVVRIGRLDPDVQRLIDPYRKFLLA
tara:strand:+ start:200 stop:814 length:615 start_codon:yes stop_codon:yes gene_type:complete